MEWKFSELGKWIADCGGEGAGRAPSPHWRPTLGASVAVYLATGLSHTPARDVTCRWEHLYSHNTLISYIATSFQHSLVPSGSPLRSQPRCLLTMRTNQLTALTCADWSSGAGEGALPAPSPPHWLYMLGNVTTIFTERATLLFFFRKEKCRKDKQPFMLNTNRWLLRPSPFKAPKSHAILTILLKINRMIKHYFTSEVRSTNNNEWQHRLQHYT